jgi:hypothetical protein
VFGRFNPCPGSGVKLEKKVAGVKSKK